MDRRYPARPMVGVGAAIFRGDQVLLVQRGREPSYGKWTLPGGLVELGESLEEAVRREVMEEVGLKVEVKDIVAALDRVIRDAEGRIEYHYILLDFLCESLEGEPLPATDVMDCAFVSIEAMGDYLLTSGTQEVVRRALDARKGVRCPTYEVGL